MMRIRRNRNRSRLYAGLLGIVLAMMCLTAAQAQDPTRFEADIQAFESADRVSPPPAEPVLFTGSSSVRMWTNVAAVFPDYPVINRGFGGSYMSDLLYYFDRVVAVYDPALVLVYEGDNDLSGGKSVDLVYSEYVEFLSRVRKQLPAADVAFIAVKPSPSRAAYLEPMRQLNERLAALAENEDGLWFIDVFTPMLDASGQPRAELFGSDMLHMNSAGYALWQTTVGAMLDEWSSLQGQSFLFDFGAADAQTKHGPAPDDPANYWNNVTEKIGGSATGNLRGAVNTRNRSTPVGLRMISPFNGNPSRSGTVTSTLFPANATQDTLRCSEDIGDSSEMFAGFKLTNLNRERVYRFTFYASNGPVLDDRAGRPASLEAQYTAAGENSASVTHDPANNWAESVAVLDGIVPDENGAITISLASTERNNRGSIHLGVMQVDESPRAMPIVFTREPADQTVMEFYPVTLEAAVENTPPYIVQWLMNDQPMPGADDLAYTIEQATLDLDGASFSVSVGNSTYSAVSKTAILHVIPDVNAPVLLSVESLDGRILSLTFDEKLDTNSVIVPDNYRVNDGQIEVMGAELDVDGKTVWVGLVTPATDQFTVAVRGVRDLAGNEIAAGTTIAGEVHPMVLLFDFGASATPTGKGPSPDDPENFWNNVTDAVGTTVGAKLANLVTIDNVPTGIGLEILSRFGGANTNGTLASTQFAADATRDSLFGNTETFSGLANVFPSFKLTGLDPSLTYGFTFYASRMGVTDNRETLYTVAGVNPAFTTLDPAANVDRAAMLVGIAPTAEGEITISLSPTDANNNANHFTYLGAMEMHAGPANQIGQR